MPVAAHDKTEPTGFRVGVDTGGTFTDLLLTDARGVVCASCKVLSTPDDPGRAVLMGIDRLLEQHNRVAGSAGQGRWLAVADLRQVVHGSTVATNALLENKTDKAALVTTAGFEDVLRLARQDRPELYALSPERPPPPIPREQVVGVDERLGYDGSVITALTQHEIDRVLDVLRGMQVASVAVCLLHSYANDGHERALAQAVRAAMPDVHLTVSSVLLPELREYERASTCVVNAAVGPTMSRYIGSLDDALGAGRLRIMASGGGTLSPRAVGERPVETVMSGPAGGVQGAWVMAQSAGEPRVIGFDMGGTSTDVALCDGGPTYTTETVINALPIRLPVIDIHTVGAGGGSIAWIDAGGALRVGPESAGADPGPACYGRQGENPCVATVTDAHAVLGHLRDGRRLGDALSVDTAAARQAVGTIAERLSLSVEATAEGILRVADAAMARAIQRVSVQRGHDAREYALVAFGGAGGLHACRLAEVLGMTRVLVPVHSGLLSAYGMLAACPRYAFSQAVLKPYPGDPQGHLDPNWVPLDIAFKALRMRLADALDQDGIEFTAARKHYTLDMRFVGQSFEITVPRDEGGIKQRFLEEHRRLYGYADEGRAIEVVAARVEGRGAAPVVSPGRLEAKGTPPQLPDGYVWRAALSAGVSCSSPSIIEEYASTTVVPAGWSARVLDDGQILLEHKGYGDA